MDTMLDVLSVLDSNGEPVYSNCTLQMGEVALEFKNGRSKVTEQHAPEVLRNPKLMVPGYTGPAAPKVPNVAAEIAGDVRQQRQETAADTEARVAASEEYLRSQGIPVPERTAPVVPSAETEELKARIAELEQMVADSGEVKPRGGLTEAERKAHPEIEALEKKTAAGGSVSGEELEGYMAAQEAVDVEAEERVQDEAAEAPEGIGAFTADGQLRCWARKGDGTQCSNASIKDSHACGLAAHKKLVK